MKYTTLIPSILQGRANVQFWTLWQYLPARQLVQAVAPLNGVRFTDFLTVLDY